MEVAAPPRPAEQAQAGLARAWSLVQRVATRERRADRRRSLPVSEQRVQRPQPHLVSMARHAAPAGRFSSRRVPAQAVVERGESVLSCPRCAEPLDEAQGQRLASRRRGTTTKASGWPWFMLCSFLSGGQGSGGRRVEDGHGRNVEYEGPPDGAEAADHGAPVRGSASNCCVFFVTAKPAAPLALSGRRRWAWLLGCGEAEAGLRG